MAAGNLARRTAGLTDGVSECRGANAQDSRGRDKRKLQIHAILPRSSNADSTLREPLMMFWAIITANFVPAD